MCTSQAKLFRFMWVNNLLSFNDSFILPDCPCGKQQWVCIYFSSVSDDKYQCHVCQDIIDADDGDNCQLNHMVDNHKEIYDLHKESATDNAGFHIEFLQVNEKDGDNEIILSVMDHSDYTKSQDKTSENLQYVISEDPKKRSTSKSAENRRRSWVWKYFDKLSSTIFKCNICNVVLSIKGCNTNNMNRHVKSKHPALYNTEMTNALKKKETSDQVTDVGCEVEISNSGKLDDLVAKTTKTTITPRRSTRNTSWVWNHFTALSKTHAQCKICSRSINHGGNATGNMNRHLRKLHASAYINVMLENNAKGDVAWIWKLFSTDDDFFYTCKMCGFKCMRFENHKKSIDVIYEHLVSTHEVYSGDQIVTAREMDECTVAVDILKDTEEI